MQKKFVERPIGLMVCGLLLAAASVGMFLLYVAFAFGAVPGTMGFFDWAPEWLDGWIFSGLTLLFYGSWLGAPAGVILFLVGLIKLLMEKLTKIR